MKHGPSHLFPDHVIVNLTLQEYAALGRILEADPDWLHNDKRIDAILKQNLDSRIDELASRLSRLESGVTVERREGQNGDRRHGRGRRTGAFSRRSRHGDSRRGDEDRRHP